MAQRPLPISTELPDELEPTDDDDLDDEERTRLHEALREGYEQARRGETISAEELFEELRRRRA